MRREWPGPRELTGTLTCELAAEAIALLGHGDRVLPGPVAGHVATCLRCQATQARYRGTARRLRQLQAERIDPPAGGLSATLEALRTAPERSVPGYSRVATAGAAAGVAGVLVWYRRRALAG